MIRVLIIVVFVVVALAVFMRLAGPNSTDRTGIGDSMVDLSDVAQKINGVEFQFGADSLRAERGPSGWVIATRDQFPAKDETIQDLVRGLISLKKSQRMTAKPDRHAELGLAWPATGEGNEARRVRIFVENSTDPIVDIVVGRAVQSPAGVYVRNNAEDQTWRCVGTLGPMSDPGAWLAGPVADISADEIQQVDFDGMTMTSKEGQWSVVSAGPTSEVTPAQNPKHEAMKGTLPYLLSGFQPEDVRRERADDLAHPDQIAAILRLDENHSVDVQLWKEGDAIWIRFAIGDCAGEPNEKLAKFAEKWSGWVFKMPTWKGGHLKPLFESNTVVPGTQSPPPIDAPK